MIASKKLQDQFRAITYWRSGLYNALWQRTSKIRAVSEDQQSKVYKAESLLREFQQLVDSMYAPEIGKAIVSEIKNQ